MLTHRHPMLFHKTMWPLASKGHGSSVCLLCQPTADALDAEGTSNVLT